METLRYNIERYPFEKLVAWAIGVTDVDLMYLHKLYKHGLFTRENDQSSPFHKRFYDNFYCVEETYQQFIKDFIEPNIGEPVVYQKVPTFRVHLVNNVAVGEEHKDSDYDHPTTEINFWLPVTWAHDTNTIWVEGKPQNMFPGSVLKFDGANKLHGNKPNTESTTRVSFDFRVIPESQFKPSDKTTINTGMKMDIGGYYERSSSIPG